MCVCAYVHTCICAYVHMCIRTYVHMCWCVRVHTCAHACMDDCTCECTTVALVCLWNSGSLASLLRGIGGTDFIKKSTRRVLTSGPSLEHDQDTPSNLPICQHLFAVGPIGSRKHSYSIFLQMCRARFPCKGNNVFNTHSHARGCSPSSAPALLATSCIDAFPFSIHPSQPFVYILCLSFAKETSRSLIATTPWRLTWRFTRVPAHTR